jgi:leader peptidase (prepilin peptidase)/N-methyltransferase
VRDIFKPGRLVLLTALALRRPGAAIVVGATAGCTVIASLVLVPGVDGILGSALALLMLLIAAIDWCHYIIPDELTVSALFLGLAEASILRTGENAEALVAALLRGIVTAMMFLILRATYRYLRGREGMGLGDVKLAGVAGVWLDWMTIPLAIEIAALTALIVYAVSYPFVRHPMRPSSRLPFGLFFAPNIWTGWLLQSQSFMLQ